MKDWLIKLRLPLIVVFFLAAVVFVVFAVFLNRAELIISAEAPFRLEVANQQGRDCDRSPCSLILAPGSYAISVNKPGYQIYSDNIELKLGEKLEKKYELIREASLVRLEDDAEAARAFMAGSYADRLANLPQDNSYFLAPDSADAYFLADHPETYLPTLYRLDLEKEDAAPEPLINLLRAIRKPQIRVNPEQTKVIIIDRAEDDRQANLYLLDLEKKTRQLIDREVLVSDLLWLPAEDGRQSFLLEKINAQTILPQLYMVEAGKTDAQIALQIQTRLSAVWPLGRAEILYAESLDPADLGLASGGFSIKLFNLRTQLATDIFSVSGQNIPQKMKYESKNRILLMLIDGAVYSLSPIL